MIYPEPGLTDQYYIPWWIILIAILAGILLLTLLVCILWKVTTTDCFAFWYRKKKRKKKDTLFSTGKNKNPVLLSGHLDFTSSSRNYHPFLWLIFYHLCSVLSCNDFIISGSLLALLIYLYPPPSLFCLLSFPTGNHYSDCFSSCTFSIPPCSDLLPQCGFFKRSERRPHYETEYYQAQLGVQPSEAEKQASEL